MPENTPPSKADISRLTDQNRRLLIAVNHLAARDRNNRIVMAIGGILIITFGLLSWYWNDRLHDIAYTNCINANDTRQQQRELWAGIVSNSTAETEKERVALAKLNDHTNYVFQDHDCNQLDKRYPPEPFPDLGLNQQSKGKAEG
jgi:hypothetical protein